MLRKNISRGNKKSKSPTATARSGGLWSEKTSLGRSLWSNLSGFPDRARVRLAYGERFTFTSSTVTGSQIMRGNSVFDPDWTGGGSQPADFDLFAAKYFTYRVISSAIKLTLFSNSTASSMRFALFPTNNTTSVVDIPDAVSNSRCINFAVNGGQAMTQVTHFAKTSTIIGNSERTASEASTAGNPTQNWYWHISYRPFDDSTSTTVYCDLSMVYDVEFFDKSLQDTDLLARMQANRKAFAERKSRALEVQESKSGREEMKAAGRQTVQSIPKGTSVPGGPSASSSDEYELVDLRSQPSHFVAMARSAQSTPVALQRR